MDGSVLDLVLILAMAVFGFSGYRQGFLVGVLSFGGFLGGGVLGTLVASPIAQKFASGGGRSLIGIATVLILASIGQFAGTTVGVALRRRVVGRPARTVDSVGGATVSVLGVLLVAWLLGTAAKDSTYFDISQKVRDSQILQRVDTAMPPAPEVFASFRRLLDEQGFPQVFTSLNPGATTPVPPPDPAVLNSPAVRATRNRVLKVVGVAKACNRRLEGTGFVYARDRVMTNAHVVAGVRDPEVELGDGSRKRGRVVVFDPRRDVAVIYVPSLGLDPLVFRADARSGDDAVVVGYPEDGPFAAVAARVRDQITAVGRDIYEKSTVRREVYALRAVVRAGNSGGPLLAKDGRVYGVIFAADANDRDTGYALTAGEVAGAARTGVARTDRVDTQGCD
ncbi:MAG TPA: MarP family serine protease [Mycobacteriales bacterium]|nr:MarP family serine protease [Mycobacteriales bacterium]